MAEFLSTPSARRAICSTLSQPANSEFLSTPSARRAIQDLGGGVHSEVISIHALREEGDEVVLDQVQANALFLSTPSARRAI